MKEARNLFNRITLIGLLITFAYSAVVAPLILEGCQSDSQTVSKFIPVNDNPSGSSIFVFIPEEEKEEEGLKEKQSGISILIFGLAQYAFGQTENSFRQYIHTHSNCLSASLPIYLRKHSLLI